MVIPYGAVFHRPWDDEIVMVVGSSTPKQAHFAVEVPDGEWRAVVVLSGVAGVDYSLEDPIVLRRVANEEIWKRIG